MLRILVLNFILASSQAKNLLNVQTIGNIEENSFFENFKIRDIAIDPITGNNDTNLPPIIPKQSGSCSNVYYEFTSSGQTATLESINYPWSYPYNSDCSYFITSPVGTQMKFSCDVFNVACNNDYLYYSLSGSPTFQGAEAYCGSGPLSGGTTSGNSLSIGFQSSSSRPFSWYAYRYRCTISVVGSSTPTTTAPPTNPPPTSPPGSCTCGDRNPNGVRIVGGTQTANGEIPWRVMVFTYDPNTGRGGVCGGTIISPNWVLTAAHCTMDFKAGNRINVYVGAQANPVRVGGGTAVGVDRYIQHPSFNRRTLDNDITLLHLATPLKYASNISPACLPYSLTAFNLNGSTVLASGWGTTRPVPAGQNNTAPTSDTLLKVNLTALSTEECLKYQTITQNQICTYNPGSDTCQGDSGGSIDYRSNINGKYYAVGIVSYGIGCAQEEYPGVYTKVTNYLSWIQANTQETYCQL